MEFKVKDIFGLGVNVEIDYGRSWSFWRNTRQGIIYIYVLIVPILLLIYNEYNICDMYYI